MKKQIVVPVVLAALMAASAYAQKTLVALAMFGTPQDVQAALDTGADLNERDYHDITPLIAAAAYNPNPEVILVLLKAGADIEGRDTAYDSTPLMWAAYTNQNPEATNTLLKAGTDVNARARNGGTALVGTASNNQNPEVIVMLLKAGSDAKVEDNDGKTAFDYARYRPILKGTDALKQLEEASK
jgi:ankyrin repeat protein